MDHVPPTSEWSYGRGYHETARPALSDDDRNLQASLLLHPDGGAPATAPPPAFHDPEPGAPPGPPKHVPDAPPAPPPDNCDRLYRRRSQRRWSKRPRDAYAAPPDGGLRIMDRSSHFSQSTGRWSVRRTYRRISSAARSRFAPDLSRHLFRIRFYSSDWFHSLVHVDSARMIGGMVLFYMGIVLTFAVFYLAIAQGSASDIIPPSSAEYIVPSSSADEAAGTIIGDDGVQADDDTQFVPATSDDGTAVFGTNCGTDINSYVQAVYFSLSMMTTIGYGSSDHYEAACWQTASFVFVQVVVSVAFNALAIGVFFQRMSRASKRARTVLFSDMAVIRRVRGGLYFMFQICELRNTQLIEARVRIYCIRHEREKIYLHEHPDRPDGSDDADDDTSSCGSGSSTATHPSVRTAHYQTHTMRLQHPDDSLGALLLMSLPSVVVHRLDDWSPLMPPPLWFDRKGHRHRWAGCDPPQMTGGDGGGGDLTPRDGDDEQRPRQVVPGFPDLLQRACDKEAEARVLLETEHGLPLRGFMRKRHDLHESQSRLSVVDDAEDGGQVILEAEDRLADHTDADYGLAATAGGKIQLGEGEDPWEERASQHNFPPVAQQPPNYRTKSSEGIEKRKMTRFLREEAEINKFLKDRESELIVLVEGIDETTGNALQARHSYRHEDIAWNMTFAPCVERGRKRDGDGFDGCIVDFGRFHYLIDAPLDCDRSPLVTNIG